LVCGISLSYLRELKFANSYAAKSSGQGGAIATVGSPGGAGMLNGGAGIGIASPNVGKMNVNPGIDGGEGSVGSPGIAGIENGGIGIGIASPSVGNVIPGTLGGVGSAGGEGILNGGIGMGIASDSVGGVGILHRVAIHAMNTFSDSSL
jgi:hypothetical protein